MHKLKLQGDFVPLNVVFDLFLRLTHRKNELIAQTTSTALTPKADTSSQRSRFASQAPSKPPTKI